MDTLLQNQKPIIEIKDLRKSYGTNTVLAGFNMVLREGENLVIMGKSGSGKSVMIKCLIGLEQPDGGSIIVMEKNWTTFERKLDFFSKEVHFTIQ